MAPFDVSEPYAPRARRAGGVLALEGWRLKTYGVAWRGQPVLPADDPTVGPAVRAGLPEPDPAAGRPGVGWVILHRGRGVDYVVLGWWDHENELPVRVWVRADGGDWRPATTESFCVWDLDVVDHERRAWVRAVLDGAAGDVEGYLTDVAPDLR